MGAFEAKPKYLGVIVLLFVFACHEVVLTHGRQIKAMNNQHSSKKIGSSTHEVVGDMKFGEDDNNDGHYSLSDTQPGHSPGVGHHKNTKVVVQSSPPDVQYSLNDTEPGHSPGVGHKKFGENDDVIGNAKVVVAQSSTPDANHSLTDTKPGLVFEN
ncbi:precursor of CEP9-like [Senna tora]|uniref:Precursor of CEP9-like n=1 Tax=Senna tora TaxID=362788 RepID=A0A834W582_9FABA|nr:precursor of CEP9-like [Senna tora]